MVEKETTKKPQPQEPPAPAAKPEGSAKTSLVARARGESAPAPPVQEGQARQIGHTDATKQSLHVTKEVDARDREKALRSAISEKVSPAGVIKLPEFDAPKSTQPAPAPKSETITINQPPGAPPQPAPAPVPGQAPAAAPQTATATAAAATAAAKSAEPGKEEPKP